MSAMSRYRYATISKRALFRKRCPLRACALYIPSLNNWQLTDVDGSAVKWIRRTASCRTVTKDILSFRWLSPPACHIALSGPVKLWDPLIICQSMIPLTPGHWPTEIEHNQPNAGTISDRSTPSSCLKQRIDQTWYGICPLPSADTRFSPYYFGPLRWTYRTISANQESRYEN